MKFSRVRLVLSIILLCVLGFLVVNNLFKANTVRAFGDLSVDFHVPEGDPIFNIINFLPGDMESKNVDVANNGVLSRFVSVKGVRTGGVGGDPKLETILDIVIADGITPIYGSGSPTGTKSLQQFFSDSLNPNGVLLSIINPNQSKTYNFKVSFPKEAGNEFQSKSVIFDLIFGIVTSESLVINEVNYLVDPSKGLDSPKDRGIIAVLGNKVTIKNNGEGSTNTVIRELNKDCQIIQSNSTNVQANINSNSSSGGNSSSNNNSSTSTKTGKSSSSVKINIQGSSNKADGCGKKLGLVDEWVEIFNPTDKDISLKNWSLTDNTGNKTIINVSKIIKANGFAILSKSASTWNFWNENPSAIKVEMGSQIGDGLDNSGDHLILKNPQNQEKDKMSWGNDNSGFIPSGFNPLVLLGSSTSRKVPGFDTNINLDWLPLNPPSPGD